MKHSVRPLRSLMSGSFDEESGKISVAESQSDINAEMERAEQGSVVLHQYGSNC